MLLVRSHQHQCLLERHILEGRHREAHHVHRLGHLGLLAHGVHPGRLDELFLELLQRASSVLCGFHLVLLITLADFTRARTCRNPRSQARGYIAGESPVASSRPALARVPRPSGGRGPTKSRRRRPTAPCPCTPAGPSPSRPPWPLSPPAGSAPSGPPAPGLRPSSARPCPRPSFLRRRLWRLRPLSPCPSPYPSLLSSFERSESALLLVGGARHVPDGYASFGPGPLHLGEVHAQLICLLPGGVSCGVLGLLGRALGGVLCSLRGLSRLVGNLSRSVLGLSGSVLDLLSGLPGRVGDLADRL